MSAPAPVLELQHVSKAFRSRAGFGRAAATTAAVRNLTLSLEEGEVFALVGESGAGKTTVGRLALGMLEPDAGQVRVDGAALWQLSAAERRRLRRRTHFIHQDPYQSLHPAMRVRDLVGEPLVIGGTPRRRHGQRVEAALEEARLTPVGQFLDRYPHQLSGGQRQRVAFARAVIGEPRLVVADEPVSMLDVSLQAGILELISRMRERHRITFLFVTHDLAVARHVADRVGVLYGGRLVELGPSERVVHDPRHPYTEALLAAVEELAPPPPSQGPFPPGGQPCARHGRCDPADPACLATEPALVDVAPAHACACHVDDLDPPLRARQGA